MLVLDRVVIEGLTNVLRFSTALTGGFRLGIGAEIVFLVGDGLGNTVGLNDESGFCASVGFDKSRDAESFLIFS